MAISLVQSAIAGADAATTSKSVSLTQPDSGNKIGVFGGAWTIAGTEPDLVNPSGLTEQAGNYSGGNWGVVFGDKTASGSGETTFGIDNANSNPMCVYGFNLSGAGALTTTGTANSAGTSQDGITVTADAAVAADGSLGIVAFYRRGKLNGGNISYSISSGWTEDKKAADGQSPADEAEMFVLTKTLNISDGTVSVTMNSVPSNSNYAAILAIYPPDNVAPVVTNPGTQWAAKGAARTIAVTVADTNSNLATLRVQSTSGKGTVSCTLGGASVSAGSLNSYDFTISGTHAQIVAAALTITYTAELTTGSDTAVIVTASDGTLNDSETFTVNLCKVIVEANTQADLNNTLSSTAINHDTAESILLSITGEDSTDRTGTGSSTVTFSEPSASMNSSPSIKRRRRRQW